MKADVVIQNEGTIWMFIPITKKAKRWIRDHVSSEPWQWLGRSLCVDHRYGPDLAGGMADAGLNLRGRAMGQYWYPVNLTKREFVNPHKLATGLKLWEQLANHPGTGAALIVLCAAMPEPRGGGDFDMDENWHGPERTIPPHNLTPGPMPEDYEAIAKRTIGRWAGDKIALIGDYAEDGDIKPKPRGIKLSEVYNLCYDPQDGVIPDGAFMDVTDDVCRVIEHELRGRFSGTGWRKWEETD